MIRFLRLATISLVVLASANQARAAAITAFGLIDSIITIDRVVDGSGNAVSATGLVIQSDATNPFPPHFEDFSTGDGYSFSFADANGGTNPESLGSGDSITISNSIEFGLGGSGLSQTLAISSVSLFLSNETSNEVTANFLLAYSFELDLSPWTDPETFATAYGSLLILHGEDENVLFLEPSFEEPAGGSYSAINPMPTSFAITLAAGQETTLEMSSFLGGEASATAVPEPTTSFFLGSLCLVLGWGTRARKKQKTSLRFGRFDESEGRK
ncbi:hypothetical protein Q31b_52210 [Novipirellula aureliae]|uniref:PEP-CTERM protein-sorting domain-containing protein n=1 Tax=Novipirellula aureliae TaxID=2527966 RepID=A0A5C6DLI4_9BACT|nr:PEP-CTERM sorting domain-containing protein [Novipirellula aureliae]TWU35786.1 hypothetical protein Q31b_52210 [Novipirellula aureliae]